MCHVQLISYVIGSSEEIHVHGQVSFSQHVEWSDGIMELRILTLPSLHIEFKTLEYRTVLNYGMSWNRARDGWELNRSVTG